MPANKNKRPCQSFTAAGRPCRAWAMHNHHLCSVHARRTIPHPTKHHHRRCHALTKKGHPCRAWARHDTDPPRCHMHAGNTQPRNTPDHQRRRCQARTRNGGSGCGRRRCRNWASRHSLQQAQHNNTPALCAAHAGQYTLRPPHKHRCSATTAAGQSCTQWAVPRTQTLYGVPLCRVHLPASDPRRINIRSPRSPQRRCRAKTLDGKPCRHWNPPYNKAQRLCWLHANPHDHPRIRHSYYRRLPHFTKTAHAHITRLIRHSHPLHAALLIVRLKLQNLAAYLTRPDLNNRRRLAATRLLYRGVNAVARLLQPQTTYPPTLDKNTNQLLYHITAQKFP